MIATKLVPVHCTSFCIRMVHLPCVIFNPMGAMMPKLLTVPYNVGEIEWDHFLTSVQINRAFRPF